MNKNISDKKYIKTAILFIGLVIVSIFAYKISVYFISKAVAKDRISPDAMIKEKKPEESRIYAIEKMKQGMVKTSEEEYNEMQKDYEKYPGKYNINYVPSPIFKVNKEYRAQMMSGLDKDIDSLKEALRLNPKDQNAKSKLFISETLKKVLISTSEYKQEELPPNGKL